MTAELLLDAIGLIDDSFLFEEASPRRISLRRTAIVFIAAILAALLTFMTAMAVSPEFKEFVYSFVKLKTEDKPPIPGLDVDSVIDKNTQETTSPDDWIQELGYREIDGMVTAQYFSTNGIFRMYEEGVFYTCDRNDDYSNPVFWEVSGDGLVSHQATRVQFTLPYGGKDHEIFFDYAIINGQLFENEWPPNLGLDPFGNGWACNAVSGRTDVVWLQVPVLKNDYDFTRFPLLLDLETRNVTNLFEHLLLENMYIDWIWLSDDLSRGFFRGRNLTEDEQGNRKYLTDDWIFDLRTNTITNVAEVTGVSGNWEYLDKHILRNCVRDRDTKLATLYQYDINSGECIKIFEDINAKHIFTNFAVVQNEDFSYSLWNLRTGEKRKLDGLYLAGMIVHESPNKNNIVFVSSWMNPEIDQVSVCYPKIAMLNTESGVFHILERDVKGKLSEYFYRWLNDTTVVTAASDGNDGMYVYMYEFTALRS